MWKRLLERLKDWKSGASSKCGLSVGEVFYRLAVWQRWILMIGALLIAAFWISMPFSVSVLPHWLKVCNQDGSINSGELSLAIGLTGTVCFMALYEFIWKSEDVSWFWKVGGAVTVAFCIWTNSGTGTATQTVAHEQRNSGAQAHNARIETLTKQIDDNTAAWQQATKPKQRTTQAMVDTLDKASKTLEKRAYDECHTGTFGMTRGPRCADLESQHTKKLEELAKVQADKDATDNLVSIELALSQDKAELKELGPKAEHADELEGFILFLTNFGLDKEKAKGWVANKPATDTLNFEFLSCFAVSPSIMLWIRLLAFLTCQRGEADRRMVEIAKEVASERAKIVLSGVPQSPIVASAPETMQPDQSEEAVLGIEGQELPLFANAPQTVAEAHAAALLKADPEMQSHPDSYSHIIPA